MRRGATVQYFMISYATLRRTATAACLFLAAVFAYSPTGRAADDLTRHASAPTRTALADQAVGKRERLEFGTDEFKGWLRNDGEWFVEGDVRHLGLLCADYEMGLRFGAGSPGCANVEWLSEVRYATRRKQCNGATVKHSGSDTEPALSAQFAKITCAERVIRCTGNCK